MHSLLLRFLRDESGATAIEYTLMATLISVAIVAGAIAISTQLGAQYNVLGAKVSAAAAAANSGG